MIQERLRTASIREAMKPSRSSSARSWLNRTVLGIALASLFSDWSHEIATAVLPAFLGSLGVAAAWLGIIEGVSDGLSSFAKLGSGFYTDRLPRRKPIAFFGYLVTALATGGIRSGDDGLARSYCSRRSVAGPRRANAGAESALSRCRRTLGLWTCLRL